MPRLSLRATSPARSDSSGPAGDDYTGAMSRDASLPPALVTVVPGPRSIELARRLAEVESRNVTCVEPTPPIFWERASGVNVWDVPARRAARPSGVSRAPHTEPREGDTMRSASADALHGEIPGSE